MKNFIEIITTSGTTASVNISHVFSVEADGNNALIKIAANYYQGNNYEYFLYRTTQDYATVMALIEEAQR